ncbi:MAG: hypothetical protein AAGC68_17870, partial [Verrucomicrobiota bacterium]
GKAVCWNREHGFFEAPDDPRRFVQIETGIQHITGLYEDGEVVSWWHPRTDSHPDTPVLKAPEGLEKAMQIRSIDFMIAAQHPDGRWTAWGRDNHQAEIDAINALGPALDIDFFPTIAGPRFLWIEPAGVEGQRLKDSAFQDQNLTESSNRKENPPPVRELLPPLAFPATSTFESARLRGGVLQQWSNERPLSLTPADEVEDLVSVEWLVHFRWGWAAMRRNGERVSTSETWDRTTNVRDSTGTFTIEWDGTLIDRNSTNTFPAPLSFPVEKALDVQQVNDFAIILTPQGKVVVATTDQWREKLPELIEEIEALEGVTRIAQGGFSFGLLLESGEVFTFHLNTGRYDDPNDGTKFVDVGVSAVHAMGLTADREVVAWSNKSFDQREDVKSILKVPEFSKKVSRIVAAARIAAVQFEDGTWQAWGDDEGTGMIDQINGFGPAIDLAIFQINKGVSKLAWIEPTEAPPSYEPTLEDVLPPARPGFTESFSKLREQGGRLRLWSEKPDQID